MMGRLLAACGVLGVAAMLLVACAAPAPTAGTTQDQKQQPKLGTNPY
jgi:hypothetical protein